MLMFYVIMAVVRAGVTIDDVQRAFTLPVMAWYRIAPNVWIVNTYSGNATDLCRLVEPLVKPTGNVFVSRLETSDKQGWMDKKFWEWVHAQGG